MAEEKGPEGSVENVPSKILAGTASVEKDQEGYEELAPYINIGSLLIPYFALGFQDSPMRLVSDCQHISILLLKVKSCI